MILQAQGPCCLPESSTPKGAKRTRSSHVGHELSVLDATGRHVAILLTMGNGHHRPRRSHRVCGDPIAAVTSSPNRPPQRFDVIPYCNRAHLVDETGLYRPLFRPPSDRSLGQCVPVCYQIIRTDHPSDHLPVPQSCHVSVSTKFFLVMRRQSCCDCFSSFLSLHA